MFTWWFIFILIIVDSDSKCVKNKFQLWSPTNCKAGRRFFASLYNLSNSIGERVVQPYLYPWLTELTIAYPKQVKSCSGALINDRYVLTAQHCILPPIQATHVTLHFGFFNGYTTDIPEVFQPRTLTRTAEKLIRHPNYNPQDPRTAVNNLGLVQVKPVQYSKTIYPIQLPSAADKLIDLSYQLAKQVAWSFSNTKKLKEALVLLLEPQQCSSFNTNYGRIIEHGALCGLTSNSGSKPCGEEHGGLLMIEKPGRIFNATILMGIAAWDPSTLKQCPPPGLPTVYVRIDHKLEWIKTNTGDGLYCRY